MKIRNSFFLSSTIFLLSCSFLNFKGFSYDTVGEHIQSIVLIGESKDLVRESILNMKSHYEQDFRIIENGDTLGYSFKMKRKPINAFFLFENDVNIYQEVEIYCSPCADGVIEDVLDDERYSFQAVDKVNYVSSTDVKAIMRITANGDNRNSCHRLVISLNR